MLTIQFVLCNTAALFVSSHYNKQTNKQNKYKKTTGMEIQASTDDYLSDLKKNHKQKGKGMFGASQCDKHRKGKKV